MCPLKPASLLEDAQLHFSVKTVEVHRVNIKAKLKLTTSPELVHYAVRWVEAQPT